MSDLLWQPAYIALGSNLEQPEQQVRHAMLALADLPHSVCVSCSSLYRSAPMGRQDQPTFINAVVALLTQVNALSLLQRLHDIESDRGRVRVEHWGPRIIDLDLLLLGDLRSDVETLRLPHPGLMQRNFVMTPLAEIAPYLLLPTGETVSRCAARLGTAGLERLV